MNSESQKIRDLHKVLEITRSMAATEDLDGLLKLIIERGMELLQAERATVFLYDNHSDELVSRVAAGTGEIRFPADRGLAGAAAGSGKVVNVPDAYADDRFNPEVDRQTGFRTRNILSVPMHGYDGSLVGVLQVLNRRKGDEALDDYAVTLAETLAAQAGVAIQRTNLIAHYLRKQEMDRDMGLARDIQQNLLPDGPPSVEGFDVAGFSRPADETGGDSYDFMALPDGKWMLTVADATGHGIGPALVVAETRAILRAICRHGGDLSTALRIANELLSVDLSDGRFVTCFFGLLDPSRAALRYASAGHGPMLFYDRGRDAFQEVSATSIPLGVLAEADFDEILTYRFDTGDLAVILTDGFFEAANRDDEEFGVDRVKDLLRLERNQPAEVIIQTLHAAVCEFTAGRAQADDLTAVIVRKT